MNNPQNFKSPSEVKLKMCMKKKTSDTSVSLEACHSLYMMHMVSGLRSREGICVSANV